MLGLEPGGAGLMMLITIFLMLAFVTTMAAVAISYLMEDDEPWVDPTWRSDDPRTWG